MKSIIRPVMVALLMICVSAVKAQLPFELSEKTPYYIDVNTVSKTSVTDIQEGSLSFQYHDKFGQWKDILLTISNWKLEVVGKFQLDKEFGLNNYTIELVNSMALENNRIYYCTMVDESGEKHEWSFKNVLPVKSKDFTASIIVNPKRLSCSSNARVANVVEFYGKIDNGQPPYKIRWYVMNNAKSDFLYQPKEDQVKNQGRTSVIKVDQAPSYYVVMDVTDACGTNVKKQVFLDCRADKKRINTIFVEPFKTRPERKFKPVEIQ